MALQANVTINETGLGVNAAYVRVHAYTRINDPGLTNLQVVLHTYADAAARAANKRPIAENVVEIAEPVQGAIAATGLVAYLYTQVKTLPEFAAAVDV